MATLGEHLGSHSEELGGYISRDMARYSEYLGTHSENLTTHSEDIGGSNSSLPDFILEGLGDIS